MIDCVQYMEMKKQRRYMSAVRQSCFQRGPASSTRSNFRKAYGDAISMLTLKIIKKSLTSA